MAKIRNSFVLFFLLTWLVGLGPILFGMCTPFTLDEIQHRYVQVNGLKLHAADIGTGPKVVILLHGFPEIWYTWRHQMLGLANAGYRAVAPDFRGYGLSEKPPHPETTSNMDLFHDLVGLADQLNISKVYVMATDFGVKSAFLYALLHRERVLGVITIGIPYAPPGPSTLGTRLPQGNYIGRFEETGRAEADFARFDVKTVIKRIYILFSGNQVPTAGPNQEILDLVTPSTPLPPWLSEADLDVYASLYQNSGFQTPLQVPYRASLEAYNIPDPILKQPALAILGRQDYFFKFPNIPEFLNSGNPKKFAPCSNITYITEGTHFLHEQFPEEVNKQILDFLARHP